MTRAAMTLLLIGLGIGMATEVGAQGERKIPVEQDLRRQERIESNIERRAGTTGALPRGAAPGQSDPSGVAGFNGPPGPIGDEPSAAGS